MRLRRRIFHPRVHTTREGGRPITITLAGLEFDLSVHDAQNLTDQLKAAITETEQEDQ